MPCVSFRHVKFGNEHAMRCQLDAIKNCLEPEQYGDIYLTNKQKYGSKLKSATKKLHK